MTRDFSQFLPPKSDSAENPVRPSTLQSLGWQPFFSQQISAEALVETPPVRVTQVHRSGLRVIGDGIETKLPPRADATVGDWLLYDAVLPQNSQLLDRKSLIKRRAPGHDVQVQLIAANIDTAFIVTSCNPDFNVARLERYIALALEADVTPVIVLTKLDQCDTPDDYLIPARAILDTVPVIALNAKGPDVAEKLADWCRPGQTVAFLGSSGVGKSTLVNALSGAAVEATQGMREDDAKGRHTTTSRNLHVLPIGCAVLDTPGMRELQLLDAASGLADVFADIDVLTSQCKFRNCAHQTEPGCAVQAALANGEIDPMRFARWQKLTAEDQVNSATMAQRKAKDKVLGKTIRAIQKKNKKKK